MHTLYKKYVFGALMLAVLLAPLSASAFLPIGGKVTAMIPCPHNPGWIVTVVGFGIGSGAFYYTPGATLTFLYGPPIIGDWILGLSDVPTVCGERATMVGTSPLGI